MPFNNVGTRVHKIRVWSKWKPTRMAEILREKHIIKSMIEHSLLTHKIMEFCNICLNSHSWCVLCFGLCTYPALCWFCVEFRLRTETKSNFRNAFKWKTGLWVMSEMPVIVLIYHHITNSLDVARNQLFKAKPSVDVCCCSAWSSDQCIRNDGLPLTFWRLNVF
jgi:hypothetical protein